MQACRKDTIALAALWVALPVTASEWVSIVEDKSVRVFADKSSFSWQDHYVRVWFHLDYPFPQTSPNGKQYWSVKEFGYFDCGLRQMSTAQHILYDSERRRVVDSYVFTLEQTKAGMQDVAPDTIGVVQLNYACKNAPKR